MISIEQHCTVIHNAMFTSRHFTPADTFTARCQFSATANRRSWQTSARILLQRPLQPRDVVKADAGVCSCCKLLGPNTR